MLLLNISSEIRALLCLLEFVAQYDTQIFVVETDPCCSPVDVDSHCTVMQTSVITLVWICPLNVCLYQTEAEQPGRCVSVGQVDECQSSYCDRGPEYTVQTAGGLMTHQQRRGHCIAVDEGSVGALQRTQQSGRLAKGTQMKKSS